MRDGAAKSGTYMKEKTSAGFTAVKQKDWSKEKEMAGKAGAATKSYVPALFDLFRGF